MQIFTSLLEKIQEFFSEDNVRFDYLYVRDLAKNAGLAVLFAALTSVCQVVLTWGEKPWQNGLLVGSAVFIVVLAALETCHFSDGIFRPIVYVPADHPGGKPNWWPSLKITFWGFSSGFMLLVVGTFSAYTAFDPFPFTLGMIFIFLVNTALGWLAGDRHTDVEGWKFFVPHLAAAIIVSIEISFALFFATLAIDGEKIESAMFLVVVATEFASYYIMRLAMWLRYRLGG